MDDLTVLQRPVDVDPVTGSTLAIFDLDRTLFPGSSVAALGNALIASGVLRWRTVARELALAPLFARRGLGDRRVGAVRERLLLLAAGADEAPLRYAADAVGRQLVTLVFPAARCMLDRHLEAGHFCVIVSASPHELVEAFASVLGVHRAVGTRTEVVDGRLTGNLDGPFCYGPGKLARLRDEIGEVDLSRAHAYADSSSDLPLLQACGHPVAVNPDRRLRAAAVDAGWPVVRFS